MSKKARVKRVEKTSVSKPEEEVVTEKEPEPVKVKEKPEQTPKTQKALEREIQNIFKQAVGEAISIKYFMDRTGATESQVALAWHSLFDKHKVPYPDLPRGF